MTVFCPLWDKKLSLAKAPLCSACGPGIRPYSSGVHRFLTPLLRRLYVFFAAFVVLYAAFHFGQYTRWNKERLYRKLVSGDREQKLAAGFDLAWLGGQEQLLRALRSPSTVVRDIATDALWNLWFRAAGRQAFRLAKTANLAMERQSFSEALALLNEAIAKYPSFAEGWNRRAILYWQLGRYEQSIADCKKVVSLNPGHFGAWQGMGLCQLRLGDVPQACQSFRAALKINPRDRGLRRLLQQAEEVIRKLTPQRLETPDWV
ncbi:MAG: tetratricopeptide repeat protein [Verrucomicrobia bacterium]|nr:MAG: tetratricopeptide repeat protein [Verrucomicrobiota bacterium]